VQFTIDRPDNAAFAGVAPELAVSPDGEHVAFVAVQQGRRMLWVRSVADTTPRVLSGTEGADYPFWSPDSRQIGFLASGKLKKVPLTGGPPTVLADATAVEAQRGALRT
jgi:Tol biopolymer transport system component